MEDLRPVATGDGSLTLFVPALGESYHSTAGAVGESRHVFVEAGLKPLIARKKGQIFILEVGFGTGLNALLTRAEVGKGASFPHPAFGHPLPMGEGNVKIHYTALEPFPVAKERLKELNYPEILGVPREIWESLHSAPWGEEKKLDSNFTLLKIRDALEDAALPGPFDLVYFDAFAPGKQPQMWTAEALGKAARAMAPGGALVTYCAKGAVKRTLKSLGLDVESLPGFGRKREMVRASRPA